MPYSVSPRLRDQTVGPKPTMYWVDLDAELLGRHEVADLVQRDAQRHTDDDDQDP